MRRPNLRRVRGAFALVAFGVLGLTALLVLRARGQIEDERRARETTVADRVFDEMERSLEDVVGREARRLGEAGAPSEEPFVDGTFRFLSDGRMVTSRPDLEPALREWLDGDAVPLFVEDDLPGTTTRYGGREGDWLDSARSVAGSSDLRVLEELDRGPRGRTARAAPIQAALVPLGPTRWALIARITRSGSTEEAGIVIDAPRLARWLHEQVLAGSSLDVRGFALGPIGARDVRVAGAAVYRHRFGPPFDALVGQLGIEPLPTARGAGVVLWLSGALVLAVIAGLVATYRMVAVVVGYSEQRANFVAAVTHELKTPLTTIRLYGEMLRDGTVSAPGPQREYHQAITEEAERLSRLIEGVLEVARLERAPRPERLSVGDVGPVVQAAVEKVRPHATAAGFALEAVIDSGLPAVRFDPDAVVQVVLNLVDNAVKYARESSDRVVTVHARKAESRVLLTVRDRGPGVDREHLARLFEPFTRGEDELTRRAGGVGLGLALVRGLAERMGASVSCRNADERGFEVTVAFATT